MQEYCIFNNVKGMIAELKYFSEFSALLVCQDKQSTWNKVQKQCLKKLSNNAYETKNTTYCAKNKEWR